MQPTPAGCLLTVLSLAVIFGLAVPLVTWRDPDGDPLPKGVAILLPILAGALCYGIGSAVLGFFGLPVLTKSKKPADQSEEAGGNTLQQPSLRRKRPKG